jgi:glutaminyl-peptide cyclotransferase
VKTSTQKLFFLGLLGCLLLMGVLVLVRVRQGVRTQSSNKVPLVFNGDRALEDVIYQVSLGPRTLGSDAHAKTSQWIADRLVDQGWRVALQEGEENNVRIKNIVGEMGSGSPWIIVGAHYDSRLLADRDVEPNNQVLPVPGANDGASGVSVLLELSRLLSPCYERKECQGKVWLVFFDAEDNGKIPGYEWILGSRYFVQNLTEQPDAVVIVDMVGDKDLNIYKERNSSSGLVEEMWQVAEELGFSEIFLPDSRHQLIDDHLPFVEKGIPAIDIIDFNYPYWHTIDDTPDKISAKSLSVVGETVFTWLLKELGK